MKPRIIVFAKDPQLGNVKTRLAQAIGAARAAQIYRAMVLDLVNELMRLGESAAIEIHLDVHSDFFDSFPVPKRLQRGATLGDKLLNAMQEALEAGVPAVVVLGSDAPELSSEAVGNLLASPSDVSFGPAQDGGFWGICARKVHLAMFGDVRWSTSDTLRDCLAGAAACSLSTTCGMECADVDEVEDLGRLRVENLGPHMLEALREHASEIVAALALAKAASSQGSGSVSDAQGRATS